MKNNNKQQKKNVKNFGTILETESSCEESISAFQGKNKWDIQNCSSFGSYQDEQLELSDGQQKNEKNGENQEIQEIQKKKQKNNLQCFIQLCLLLFGLMLISFSVNYNRPNLTAIEPVGAQIPIYQLCQHFFSFCGIFIAKNMFYKEGLKKCYLILGFMLFFEVLINVSYDYLICPKICSTSVLSLNQRNGCLFIYVVLLARALFEGMCYSIGIILIGVLEKKVLALGINVYKNNPVENFGIKQMFYNCLKDTTLQKWLAFTILQSLILGYYEISHKFIIMNNIQEKYEDNQAKFMQQMVNFSETSLLVTMWSMVAASGSMITTSQLTNVIYCLEVFIGIIYIFQFICLFFGIYKNNGQTLFMNLQQRNQYNLEYSQKKVQEQQIYQDNIQPLLLNQYSSNSSPKKSSLKNISKFNDYSNSPVTNQNCSNYNVSTFQSTQFPMSYNIQGIQINESQANFSNNFSNINLVNASRNLQQNLKYKNLEIQIQPEEFFSKYDKCYKEDNQEEIILGKGSSATVYLYKRKNNQNQQQQNNNNINLSNINQSNVFLNKQNSHINPDSQNKNCNNNKNKNSSQNKEDLIAVKIVTGGNKNDLDNCLSEVQTVIRIQMYPNIIKIHNYTIIQQQSSFSMYVAMDYGENSLADEIKKRKICQPEKNYFQAKDLEVLAQKLIFTLSELQQMENITHRDIKPQNILKIKDVYCLADFGEAKRFTVENILKDPTIRGTVKYLSPELRHNYDILCDELSDRESICNLKEWDSFKSDVFSLGLTLIEAATLENIVGFNLIEDKLNKGLNQLKKMNLYSDWFIQLISLMLVWESSKRPTFPLLKNYIIENMQIEQNGNQNESEEK